jgi:peroxiredoxin
MEKITFLLTVFTCLVLASSFSIDVGDMAPSFANPDINGIFTLLKDVIGKGWIIIDFFTTDCEGCKKEITELEELLEWFENESLKITIFAVDTIGLSSVKPFFDENPTNMTVLLDKYQVFVQNYHVEEIPAVFLINPEGTVVFKAVGYNLKTVEEIRTILLNEL